MLVGIVACPLLVAERVEASISLVKAEAEAEYPLYMRKAFVGTRFRCRKIVSPFAKLI